MDLRDCDRRDLLSHPDEEKSEAVARIEKSLRSKSSSNRVAIQITSSWWSLRAPIVNTTQTVVGWQFNDRRRTGRLITCPPVV